MRLADLLARLGHDDLEHLAAAHAHTGEPATRAQLLLMVESGLRSYRFVYEFLMNRQPPAFAILRLLIDSGGEGVQSIALRDRVATETKSICLDLDSGTLLGRDSQLRIYRRVLYQMRANDMLIDPSEAAVLGVLRSELDIALIEHYLIEHHSDLREFWQRDGAFLREMNSLRSTGIVFESDGRTLIPEDLCIVVRRAMGIELSRPFARRLFEKMTLVELQSALASARLPVSGAKEERIDRLIQSMVQPSFVLKQEAFTVARLRDLCRELGGQVSGTKEELVARILHLAAVQLESTADGDAPPAERPREELRLDPQRARALFMRLRGQDLAAVLGEFDLRRSGAKEQQVGALLEAGLSEATVLAVLSLADLESVLRKLNSRTSGSKAERIERILQYFETMPLEVIMPDVSSGDI